MNGIYIIAHVDPGCDIRRTCEQLTSMVALIECEVRVMDFNGVQLRAWPRLSARILEQRYHTDKKIADEIAAEIKARKEVKI